MKTKNNTKSNLEEIINQNSKSFEDTNPNQKMNPNNLKLLNEMKFSKNDFYNKDNGKILNVDYIPKELFTSYINNNQTRNNNIIQNSHNNIGADLDFKISNNDFNISETLKKSENMLSLNILSSNQKINPNLHINTIISKETSINRRYNADISINNSINKNNNLNSNIPNNENVKVDENVNNNNIMSNESSTLRQNLSNCNGLSDNFINSKLNISNTIVNDSNILSSNNNHYLDKIRLRELENKEKFLYELENKRNKNVFNLIQNQKLDFLKKIKEIEKNNLINNNEILNNQKINSDKNSLNITYNNDNVNIKEKEENNNLSNLNKNNNEIISYFNKIKEENIKYRRNSNRSMGCNHRTSSSFYTKKPKNFTPFISSAITDINNNNIFQNKIRISQKKPKHSKSSNKLSISKNSMTNPNQNSSSHLFKSIKTNNDYNQGTSSLKILNSIRNNNKDTSKINKVSQIKRKSKFINPKGKEKIQDKYNIYFNCYMPDLYEEQRKKLINEKKVKKAKSTVKIKKLDDYVGPNLYNKEIDMPDFGYICYKTNKKINPKYSLNNPIYSYNNEYGNSFRNINRLNNLNEEKEIRNVNLKNIYNKYENEKNNTENDIFNYGKFSNNRNKNTLFQDFQNHSKTEYKEESLIHQIEYNNLYNKAFNQFSNYPYNNYHEQQEILFQNDI